MSIKYQDMTTPFPIQPLPVWTLNLYDAQWHEHDKYQDELKEVCRQLESQNKHSRVSRDAKRNLYESSFDFVKYENKAVQAWANWTTTQIFDAAKHANKDLWPVGSNVSVNIHESWCHITRDGGYHDMHIHPNSSWSVIYYLDTGDMNNKTKNGVNRFFSPFHNMYTDAGTMWSNVKNSIDIEAEPGMMVIFPSWIQHSALVYHGQRDRFVLSLNCQIHHS